MTTDERTEDQSRRVENLEILVDNLSQQVRSTELILKGYDEIGYDRGIMIRVSELERRFSEQSQLLSDLAYEIQEANKLRRHQSELDAAREEERLKSWKTIEKVIKIVGPLLAVGLGADWVVQVVQFLSGMP